MFLQLFNLVVQLANEVFRIIVLPLQNYDVVLDYFEGSVWVVAIVEAGLGHAHFAINCTKFQPVTICHGLQTHFLLRNQFQPVTICNGFISFHF